MKQRSKDPSQEPTRPLSSPSPLREAKLGGPGLGDLVGPFRLMEHLGAGGMGTVYLAEQKEPVHRRVALKVVRPAFSEGAEAWEYDLRFAAERQALARLSHPNVAQLYESGELEDGAPYFAMEFVPGSSITDFCDEHQLSIEQRLRVFLTACRGVEHAHQKGVLHRDLKPANVLVTTTAGEPAAKVIDFGIAKGVDEPLAAITRLTSDGVVGTLAYLSPEAIRAAEGDSDLDTRADVFSLGVLLHELLVGVQPQDFSGSSTAEILERILEADILAPSRHFALLGTSKRESVARAMGATPERIDARLRGDLDWIGQRATASRREDRYASVGELAADLERFLADEPVTAGPPTAGYRLRKFVRRNRVGVLAGAAVVAALLFGIAGTTYAMVRALRAEEVALQEAAAARQAQAESEGMLGFVTDLFKASKPGSERRDQQPVGEVLDRGAAALRTELADQPLVRARLMGTVGNLFQDLGNYRRSSELLAEALGVRQTLAQGEPDLKVATAHHDLANVLHRRGLSEEAEVHYRAAVDLRRRLVGDGHVLVGRALLGLANAVRAQGRDDEALELGRQAVESLREAYGDDSSEYGRALAGYSNDLTDAGRNEEARRALEEALEIFRANEGESHLLVGMVLHNLGELARTEMEYARAEELVQESLDIMLAVLGEDHPRTVTPRLTLGSLLITRARYGDAEPLLLTALELGRRHLVENHRDILLAEELLGHVYEAADRVAEAEVLRRRVLEVRRAELGDGHPRTVWGAAALGRLLCRRGALDEARRVAERARTAQTTSGETLDQHDEMLMVGVLACVEARRGSYEHAIELYPAVIDSTRVRFQAAQSANLHEETLVASMRSELALALIEVGRRLEARDLLELALPVLEQRLGAGHRRTIEARELVSRL